MSRRSLGALALVACLSLVGAACSSKSASLPNIPGTSPPAAAGAQVHATAGLTFNPVTTTIKAGQTVTWLNNSMIDHNVTFDSGPAFSQALAGGTQLSRTFNTAGSFPFHCKIHGPSMHGTIVVT
jgi:plastocyanin